jgi:hypothetical protein
MLRQSQGTVVLVESASPLSMNDCDWELLGSHQGPPPMQSNPKVQPTRSLSSEVYFVHLQAMQLQDALTDG